MQTVNGKLIVEGTPDLDNLKQNIENLAQQFECLEVQITAISKKQRTEYLEQLTSVKQYLHKLERIYNRLLSTTILTAIALGSWYVWQGLNHDVAPAKLQSNLGAIASFKEAEARSQKRGGSVESGIQTLLKL